MVTVYGTGWDRTVLRKSGVFRDRVVLWLVSVLLDRFFLFLSFFRSLFLSLFLPLSWLDLQDQAARFLTTT